MRLKKSMGTAVLMAAAFMMVNCPILRAEEGALKDFGGKLDKAWEKMWPEVEINRGTYTRIAGEDLDKVGKTLRDFKGKTPVNVPSNEWENILSDLDQKKAAAENRYAVLKGTGDDNWKSAKSDLDSSLKDAKKGIAKAADKAFSEKEAYEVKAQEKINDLDIHIQKREANLDKQQGDEKAKNQAEIQKLKDQKSEASKHLEAIKKDKTESWKNHKEAFEAGLKR